MDYTELSLTTPALLFPAISLLMLAYTNRFVVLAQLVRDLYTKNKQEPDIILEKQIANLRKRIIIIRNMQIFGALSFFFCVMSMFLIYARSQKMAGMIFGISLIFLLVSLALLILELQISVHALSIQLDDVEDNIENKN